MTDEPTSCAPPRADAADAAQALDVRSGIYALLARGFSHPDASVVEFLHQCAAQGQSDAAGPADPLRASLDAFLACARAAEAEELQSAYLRLFDPVGGPFPYETEHTKFASEFFKAQHLADIMGYYRAFGVEPRRERADDMASELEFMHLLTLKEAHALRTGKAEQAALCREAQAKFFREHLAAWSDAFLEALGGAGREPAPFYARLMDLLRLFIESEKEELP